MIIIGFLLTFSDVKPLDEKAPTLFDQVKTHLYDTGKSAWNNYISPNLLKGLQDDENKKFQNQFTSFNDSVYDTANKVRDSEYFVQMYYQICFSKSYLNFFVLLPYTRQKMTWLLLKNNFSPLQNETLREI